MPILSFSSNDIDVITGKPEQFVKHGKLHLKLEIGFIVIGI